MQNHYKTILLITLLFPQLSHSTEYKRVYDKVSNRAEEICLTDPDGRLEVAKKCNAGLFDPLSTLIKRQKDDLVEVISPKVENSYPRGVFNHSIVNIEYSLSDGRSAIQIIDPYEKSDTRYSKGSYWLVDTKSIDLETDKDSFIKKGEIFCLNKSHGKYSEGQSITIIGIYPKDKSVYVTFNKSFLARFFDFYFHDPSNLINYSDLKKCENEDSIDPSKLVQITNPSNPEDLKVNDQSNLKTIPLPNQSVRSWEQESNSISK